MLGLLQGWVVEEEGLLGGTGGTAAGVTAVSAGDCGANGAPLVTAV